MKKIAMICDTSGKDDEGMKKVSRNLAKKINDIRGFEVDTINTKECLNSSSQSPPLIENYY